MAEKEYQRLTRARLRRAGFFTAVATRSSLWLGKDHLLGIDSNGYGEDYKRFYFRDIQVITTRKTDGQRVRAGVYGFLAGACALGAWVINDIAGITTMGVIGLPCAVLFVFNLALGPMSVCHLRTAVQVEELPSLNRIRRARKVLDHLRPLIAAAQGQLAPEEIPARMQELASQQSARYVADDPNAPPRIIS
jgi:hypothetical protein